MKKELDKCIELLRAHVGEDARLVYNGAYWSVDVIGYPSRTVLASNDSAWDASKMAVYEYCRRHQTRNSL